MHVLCVCVYDVPYGKISIFPVSAKNLPRRTTFCVQLHGLEVASGAHPKVLQAFPFSFHDGHSRKRPYSAVVVREIGNNNNSTHKRDSKSPRRQLESGGQVHSILRSPSHFATAGANPRWQFCHS